MISAGTPGFNRDFAFEAWNWVDKDLVQSGVRDETNRHLSIDWIYAGFVIMCCVV